MPTPETTDPSFAPSRRWRAGLNTVISLASLLALVVMANYLAARHHQRYQWSAADRFELSPQTRQLLRALTNEVGVVVFFDTRDPLYSWVSGLLREYQFASPRVTVKTVDYDRYPDEALLIKAKYKLPVSEDKDMVIFEANGRPKIVYHSELSDFDLQGLLRGETKEIKRTAFKGEAFFNAAILSVTDPAPLKACFLQDHGEHRLEEDSDAGYSKFAAVLKASDIAVESLQLRGTTEIPPDCQLLIIAGPRLPFTADELAKIEQYLTQGGRLFALFNFVSATNRTGLESLLAKWGVEVGFNAIRDPDNSTTGQDLLSARIGTHPIVRPLVLDQLPVDVFQPRTVQPLGLKSSDAPKVEPLFMTGDNATVVTDFRGGLLAPNPRDPRGSFAFMVAVEKGNIQGISAGRGATRLVVAGDSSFLSNAWIDRKANSYFAGFAANWLLDRSLLLGNVGPRPVKEYTLQLTRSQLNRARWILLGALPGSVMFVGLVVWFRRRK